MPSSPEVAAAVAEIGTIVDEFTERAKTAYAIDDHFTGDDIVALTNGIHYASRSVHKPGPEHWQGYLAVVLKGMQR